MADSVPSSTFPLDDRNINLLCASLLIQTWVQLGLREAVVCPGSRSGPLAIAAAAHPDLLAIPCLDERSAGFFALGMAMRSHRPVILICTSGTAGANFYPAVIEATARGIPLVILTADRPPELRHCHAGQAIDQLKLFGTYPRWQTELPIPEPDPGVVRYWRQMALHGWERSQFPDPGVVHFNIPLREPLAPLLQADLAAQAPHWHLNFSLTTYRPPPAPTIALPADLPPQGVIIAGLAQPVDPVAYSRAVARLAQTLGYPILADGLSPLRHHQDITGPVISTYDLILRDRQTAHHLTPQAVIQLGPLPTSKILRQWLEATQPRRWVIDPRPDNFDPLQGRTLHLRTTVEAVGLPEGLSLNLDYGQTWQSLTAAAQHHLDQQITKTTPLIAAKVPWLLAQYLPPETPVVIANSMAVRDVEAFWPGSDRRFMPYCNRGANGIDGTVSTALGIAHNHRPTVLLTGDLALLHDINGLLLTPQFQGHLTIIVINNQGGGIFEHLPIAQFDPPYTDFFATPQGVDLGRLCAAYGVAYQRIEDWPMLITAIAPLPTTGIRLLEIPTQRQRDAVERDRWFKDWPDGAGSVEIPPDHPIANF